MSYEYYRNQRSSARDALAQYINQISVSDMDSIRSQTGMLALLTSQTNEITRQAQVFLSKIMTLLMIF
jgi:hypothetical protein